MTTTLAPKDATKNVLLRTQCIQNFSQTWAEEHAVRERDHTFRLYHGYPALPFVIIGLTLTILFAICVLKAVRDHRVSRKFYILLLNRAIGDAIACVAALVTVIYVESAEHVSNNVTQVMHTLFVASFWSAMVSYVSLGLLKLYGIARPLHYRNKVTMKRCIRLIILSWVAFAILFLYTMSVNALVKIPFLAEWSGCRSETCLRYMYTTRNGVITVVYFFTIICFLVTVVLIRRARKISTSFHRQTTKDNRQSIRTVRRRFRFPLIKLALNVATFSVFHMPYSVWTLFFFYVDGCYFLLHYNPMQMILGLMRLSILLRIIIDVLISFATDKELRKSFLLIFGCHNKISPSVSGSRRSTATNVQPLSDLSMGEISSESVGTSSGVNPSDNTEDKPKKLSRISFVDGKTGVDMDTDGNGKRRSASAKDKVAEHKSRKAGDVERSATVKSIS
ncbi:DihydroCaffeic Acid Receptor [Ditylenchus destructor]|uniref:DihydroCaffeic Acid Receptor n=1 Tax=Ditylenchus destructor TaxID=166010 RepID=A0AAD4R3V4_9BILA|nr:DihydroCaffeic Acid Receptor [Ditylenchus destructor]